MITEHQTTEHLNKLKEDKEKMIEEAPLKNKKDKAFIVFLSKQVGQIEAELYRRDFA